MSSRPGTPTGADTGTNHLLAGAPHNRLDSLTEFTTRIEMPNENTTFFRAASNAFSNRLASCCLTHRGDRLRAQPEEGTPSFRLVWADIDGNRKLTGGDRLTVAFDESGTGDFTAMFPQGWYTMTLVFQDETEAAAELPRLF